MQPRITRMMGTVYGGFFMILLKVVISGQDRQMSIVWHRSAIVLLISALPRELLLEESMEVSLQIEVLVAVRYQEHFMPEGRPDSNCY